MLAGMQLEVFTPLKAGPMTAEQIAAAIGIGPSRLRLVFALGRHGNGKIVEFEFIVLF
jgi:hypothetical protein